MARRQARLRGAGRGGAVARAGKDGGALSVLDSAVRTS